MAFDFRNWGVISTSGNTQSETLQDGSVIGAPGMYTYQSATETLLDISSVDYFSPVGNTLSVGDFIYIQASDSAGLFHVLAVDFETGNLIIALLSGGGGGGIIGPLTSTPNSPALWNSLDGSTIKDGSPWLFVGADLSGGTNINVSGYVGAAAHIFKDTGSVHIIGVYAPSLTGDSIYFLPPSLPGQASMMFLTCNDTGFQSWGLPGVLPGTHNSFIGISSGSLGILGDDNTYMGWSSGAASTTASNNTAFGSQALDQLTTGSGNVCIGRRAGHLFTGSETNNVCVGSEGIVNLSNTIFLGEFGVHDTTYVAGILGNTATSPRMVTIDNSTGQLCEQAVPASAAFTPVTVTGATQALLNLGTYYVSSGVQTEFTMPLAPSPGDVYRITLINGSGSSFKVTPNTGQVIQVADGITSSGGYITSIGNGGSITIECIQAASDIFAVVAQTIAVDVV